MHQPINMTVKSANTGKCSVFCESSLSFAWRILTMHQVIFFKVSKSLYNNESLMTAQRLFVGVGVWRKPHKINSNFLFKYKCIFESLHTVYRSHLETIDAVDTHSFYQINRLNLNVNLIVDAVISSVVSVYLQHKYTL